MPFKLKAAVGACILLGPFGSFCGSTRQTPRTKTVNVYFTRFCLPDDMAQGDHRLPMTRDQEVWGMVL